MQVHYNIDTLPRFQNAVLTIGSFDGIHKGHRSIIDMIIKKAKDIKGESVLLTFDPHPSKIIFPQDSGIKILTTLQEKIEILESIGIDHLVIAPFTYEFSRLEADEYLSNFLVKNFNPDTIVIGYDHRFGLNRSGGVRFLRMEAEKYGYEVIEIKKQIVEEIAVSSTQIRKALFNKELIKANHLLGYNYKLSGKVIEGLRIGQTLGYPTANLKIENEDKLIPPFGIYAVRVLHDTGAFQGMLYIGTRPTLADQNDLMIEINIFDFHEQIYGDHISLEIVAFVREDKTFDDLESLAIQIKDDEKVVRNFFKRYKQDSASLKCAVVVLNYNGIVHLKNYFEEINAIASRDIEIIVADNASNDDSVFWLKENYPDIRIIQLKENYGFAGGYNQALNQVDAEYYVLLNSDVRPGVNFPSALINRMENDSTIGACQPKVLALKSPKHFEYAGAAGGLMDSLGYPLCRGRILESTEEDLGQYDSNQEIFWATGAAMVIRADLYHNLGGLDDWYFAHQEEIDLCWRIKRAGYKIEAVTEATIFHLGGGTLDYMSERKTFLNFRNSLASIVKNNRGIKMPILVLARLLLDGLAAVYFLVKGQLKHFFAVFKAHVSFYKGLPVILKKRANGNIAVKENSIGPDRSHIGRIKGSIVWEYYAKQNRTYKDLMK